MGWFIVLCLLLYVGYLLRSRLRVLQWLYLPSSIVGGLIGLAVVQAGSHLGRPLPEGWLDAWGSLPGALINVVFACLFLGVKVPGVRTLWRRAGPQLAYGQIVAWGQYVVGVGLVLLVLGPAFGVGPVFGGLVPVGFEGGHGTAAGLGPKFDELGWPEGKDLALASATAGVTSAILVGMALVNWAARRGHLAVARRPDTLSEHERAGIIPLGSRPPAGRLTVSSDVIGSLTLQVAVIGVAVLIGYGIQQGLSAVAGPLRSWAAAQPSDEALGVRLAGGIATVVESFPLFPLCMLGGLVVQLFADRFDRHALIDPGLMRRVQNTSLDFLVVAAIATIQLRAVAALLAPFAIIVAAAILWNVFCVVGLARRLLPDAWFERAIAEMGQSMGVTATGLLLLRVVDPDYETPAANAFAAKQLLHEPFMGGGLWTSTAVIWLAAWGGWPVFLIASAAVAFWLVVGLAMKAMRLRAEAGA